MVDESSHPTRVSQPLDFLRKLLGIGWKLCHQMDHGPVQDPVGVGGYPKDAWHVCLASVPDKVGLRAETRWNSLLGSQSSTVLLENPPGHRQVVVESTPESDEFLKEIMMASDLEKPAKDPHRYLLPVQRAFVRLDVAKFSQYPVGIQPLVLAEVQETANEVIKNAPDGTPSLEEVLHTGDGFILVYPWTSGGGKDWLLTVAAMIAAKLDVENDDPGRVPIHFRISITLGDVYLTKDLLGRNNYIGQALTETERLISCIPSNLDDLVYFSDSVYRHHRDSLSFFPGSDLPRTSMEPPIECIHWSITITRRTSRIRGRL